MAWFRRKKTVDTTLPQMDWYQQDFERRERERAAWLMAILSVFVAVVIIIGLFFGIRIIYRHNKHIAVVTVKPGITQTVPSVTDQNSNNNSSQSSTAPTTPLTHTPDTSTPPTTTTTQPTSSKPLPNTGVSSVVPIFIATTIVTTVVYSAVQKEKFKLLQFSGVSRGVRWHEPRHR